MRPEPQAVVRSTMPEAEAATHGVQRGEVHDERGAKRRREEDAAVVRAMPSHVAATVSARQAR